MENTVVDLIKSNLQGLRQLDINHLQIKLMSVGIMEADRLDALTNLLDIHILRLFCPGIRKILNKNSKTQSWSKRVKHSIWRKNLR